MAMSMLVLNLLGTIKILYTDQVSQQAHENVTVSLSMAEPQKITEGMYKMAMANFLYMPGNNLLKRRKSLKIPPYDIQANNIEAVIKSFKDGQTNKLQIRTMVNDWESFQ